MNRHLLHAFSVAFWLTLVALPAAPEAATPDARALLERGKTHAQALELDRALLDLEAATEGAREAGDVYLEVEALLALGHTYRVAGAPRRGFPWILEAIDRSADLPADARKGRILCSRARARNAVGEREEAWNDLEEALEIFRRFDDRAGRALAHGHRAMVAVHARWFAEAVSAGREVLASPEAGAEDRLRAFAALAYVAQQREELREAAKHYDRVIELAWELNDQAQLNFAYCNRAEVRWRLGETRPVREDLDQAIDGFEKARALITGNPRERASFLSRQVAAYERLIRFLVDTAQGPEAFEIAERFHGRSFLELLDEPALAELARRRPDLEARRLELLRQLGQARLELSRDGTEPPTRKRHDELENELLSLQADLLWQGRDPRREINPAPPTQEQVQNGLEPGETLVAYWVDEERILIWAVQGHKTHFVQVPVPRRELEARIEAYLEPLRSTGRAEDLALDPDAELRHLEIGRHLYEWLIGSLPGVVVSSQRLILVPDGVLHHLPFESLVTRCRPAERTAEATTIHEAYSRCSFLGLEKPLAYSPSAGVFLSLRERHRRRRTEPSAEQSPSLLALAPAFGNPDLPTAELRQAFGRPAPLRFTRQEVETIGALFPGSSTLLDQLASERRLKAEAGRYRLLHLATHGLVRDDLPMSSGLLLAAGEGEDGLLQAHEVLSLELEAELVTLSACRSGRGELGRGEGIFGLGRSFLSAGAASVLVSLWDVDDRSTPRLMESFYRRLSAGSPAPEALVAARRELFHEHTEARLVFHTRPLAYAHPRFWASFVLLGGF